MRKFRFIGNPDFYSKGYISKNQIVDEDYFVDSLNDPIEDLVKRHPEDWEEIFDEPKPLHKDTDFGYFEEIMVANAYMIHDSINRIKELIKQLDAESK